MLFSGIIVRDLLFFLVAVATTGASEGFSRHSFFFVRKATTIDERTTSSRLHATEKLVFKGDYVTTTDPLPTGTTEADIADFLSTLGNRDIFLSAGGTREVEEMEMTPQLKRYWRGCCKHFNSDAIPSEQDKLVAVATEIHFPGLTIQTTSVSGIIEIRNEQNILEAFEAFLIAEKSEPKGTAPVVWIYNKLTGNNKREKGVFQPPKQTKAKSTIGSVRLEDGSLALSFKLNMQITIEFPAMLLKILTTSKEKAEEQGSTSVLKTVSKDIESARMAAYDKFIEQGKVQQ